MSEKETDVSILPKINISFFTVPERGSTCVPFSHSFVLERKERAACFRGKKKKEKQSSHTQRIFGKEQGQGSQPPEGVMSQVQKVKFMKP